MSYSLLIETISLLEEIRSRKSNTSSCVTRKIDEAIRTLASLRGEKVSEPEMATMILQELDKLFVQFPEIRELLNTWSE